MGKGHSSDSDGGGSGLFAGMGVGSKKSNLFTAYINYKSNGGKLVNYLTIYLV